MRFIYVMLILLLTAPLTRAETVSLHAGMNLLSITTESVPPLSSHGMGIVLGADLRAFSRIDADTKKVETTTFATGVAQGPNFPVQPGEGYIAEMVADTEVVLDGAVAADVDVDLAVGVNLVGFHPVAPVFRAFDLMRILGDGDIVASVGRFNPESGRYQIALQSAGEPAGRNFLIRAGDGLLISMREPVDGFSVPAVGLGSASDDFTVSRHVLSGGGGMSEAGGLALLSVVAQTTSLRVSESANHRLTGGFLATPID